MWLYGLLRRVRVFGTGEDLHARHHLARDGVLGEHAPDGFQDHALGMELAHAGGREALQAVSVAGVALIFLLLLLLAGELHLRGVDHDHERAGIDRRIERRRILRAELVGDHDRQAAENLVFSVHQEPGPVVAGVRGTSAFLHCLVFLSCGFVPLSPGDLSVLAPGTLPTAGNRLYIADSA